MTYLQNMAGPATPHPNPNPNQSPTQKRPGLAANNNTGSSTDGDQTAARKPNGQFARGYSGNKRGRPRKRERSATSRQLRRDIFAELERPLAIDGQRQPAIRVILQRLVYEAAKGDRSAIKMALDLYKVSVSENEDVNRETSNFLDTLERHVTSGNMDERDPVVANALNRERKKTRNF